MEGASGIPVVVKRLAERQALLIQPPRPAIVPRILRKNPQLCRQLAMPTWLSSSS